MHLAEPRCAQHSPDLQRCYTHAVAIGADPLGDAIALPDSRGVVAMIGDGDRPVFLAATGDCREITRRKLAPVEKGVRAGADLRSLVREVRAVQCGSAFEADLVYMLLAAEIMPAAAKLVAERWRSWWAQIDPQSEFPEWSKTDLAVGAVAPRSASTGKGMIRDAAGSIVGPFGDKDAAGRFIERMVDAFDLCREHRLLVLAPRALACPYKEMGRCAAPCDGSESMDSYRSRVRAAVDAAAGDGIDACAQQQEASMRAAATLHDFEAAARSKAQVERLKKLAGPTGSRIGRLEDFRFLVVWRGTKDGWARLAVCDRGAFRWLADFRSDLKGPDESLIEVCSCGCAWADSQGGRQMDRREVDVLGLLARERVLPDKKRTAWFIPLNRDGNALVSARAVLKAAAAAWKPRKAAGGGGSDAVVHELEAMPEEGGPS